MNTMDKCSETGTKANKRRLQQESSCSGEDEEMKKRQKNARMQLHHSLTQLQLSIRLVCWSEVVERDEKEYAAEPICNGSNILSEQLPLQPQTMITKYGEKRRKHAAARRRQHAAIMGRCSHIITSAQSGSLCLLATLLLPTCWRRLRKYNIADHLNTGRWLMILSQFR